MGKPIFIARQASHPKGLLGWVIAQVMSRETGWENNKAIDLLGLQPGQSVLDVGCGHGASLKELARRVQRGRVAGLDPSAVMVGVAQKKARSRTIEIVRGQARDMPFETGAFDAVMSVHTIYFWDDPVNELREIKRVVAPNGRFVLGFRSSRDQRFVSDSPQAIYHIRSLKEVEALLNAAGWVVEDIAHDRARGALFHWAVCRPA
jgi:ubiquinone/menaquinone biosynthesis C-methylase UbiE